MIHFRLFDIDFTSEMLIFAVLLLSVWVSHYRKKIPGIFPFHPVSLIVTLCNSGRSPILSGTVGTLFATYLLVCAVFLPRMGVMSPNMLIALLFASIPVTYLIGVWAIRIYLEKTGREDPKEVVIDELVGMYIAVAIVVAFYSVGLRFDNSRFLLPLMFSPIYLAVIFLLFRVFDMAKPWHVGWCDTHIKGAHGVMLDDVVAGIYAGVGFVLLFLMAVYTDFMGWMFEWLDAPAGIY